MSNLQARPFDWRLYDDGQSPFEIHCWGLNRESKPVLIRIEKFLCSFYIELPMFVGKKPINWPVHYGLYYEWLRNTLKKDAPVKHAFVTRQKLYYYRGDKKFPMLFVAFDRVEAMNHCKNLIDNKSINVPSLGGLVSCRVHEKDISIVRKFLTVMNIEYAQWVTSSNYKKVDSEYSLSAIDEYIVEYKDLKGVSPDETVEWFVHPKVCSFDIETYSPNHNAFPKENSACNDVYIITLIFQQFGKVETRKRYALYYGELQDTIPGTTLICENSEVDLINRMCEVIRQEDPDIMTGFNICRFDYRYLNCRLSRKLQDWPFFGRLKNKPCTFRSDKKYHWLDIIGRITVDVMPVVKRDYKLINYDLNTVSLRFLKRGKHPVKAKDMFRYRYAYMEARKNMSAKDLAMYWSYRKSGDPGGDDSGDGDDSGGNDGGDDGQDGDDDNDKPSWWENLNAMLDQADSVEAIENFDRAVNLNNLVIAYGIEDSELVMDLFDYLSLWLDLLEKSSINGVTISDVYMAGQQIRCLSLLYHEAAICQIIVDDRKMPQVYYEGGYVQEPIKGKHKNTICLDFASLYPSIIRESNICYTTLVPPEDTTTPDSDCRIIEWVEEIDHDKKNKKKKKDIMSIITDELKLEKGPLKTGKETVHHRYRFYKHRPGILPRIEERLVTRRTAVRELLKEVKDETQKTIFNSRQNALKTTCNAFYGFLGVQEYGKLPLIEAAMAITARGRELIKTVNTWLQETYNARVIYNDTDSSFVDMGLQDSSQANQWGKRLSEEISGTKDKPGLFRHPLKMEFEKAMGEILLLKKKHYVAILIDKNGKMKTDEKDWIVRGVTTARRDNCSWVKDLFGKVIRNILLGGDLASSLDILIREVKMFMETEDYHQCVLIREMGSYDASSNFYLKTFSEELHRIGKPIAPGDRVDFVICDVPGATKTGRKMRLLDDYIESQNTPDPLRIDKLYYIEHLMKNHIEKLFYTAYPEVETMKNGYKPKTAHHFVTFKKPVHMCVRMIHDKVDLSTIKDILLDTRTTTVPTEVKRRPPKIVIIEKPAPLLLE